jgi:hypothetical protein
MNATRTASIAAVLGGLVWVAAAVLAWEADVATVGYVIGLWCLLVALAAGGYALVDHAPAWLRAVVSVATPALGFGVWFSVEDAVDRNYATVLAAAVLALVAGLVGVKRGAAGPARQPVRGGHRAPR